MSKIWSIALPGADVVAAATALDVDERVYRLALTLDEIEIIRDCIGNDDPLALQEAHEFFRVEASDLPALLNGPFTPQTPVSGKNFAQGRFSNGDHPVFYSARDPATAGDEYAHNAPKYFNATMGAVQFRIHLIDCRFAGTIRDLRPLTPAYPDLVSNAHNFCQKVGAAAVVAGVHGFYAESVRHAGGTTVPVFFRAPLSNPRRVRDAICYVDSAAGSAAVQLL